MKYRLEFSKFFILILVLFSVSFNVYADNTCVALTKNLSKNKKVDPQVKALQNFLHSNGYLSATPNGVYGSDTESAVRKFQKAKGLSVVGSAGPATRAMIEKLSCTTLPAPTIPKSGLIVPVVTTPTIQSNPAPLPAPVVSNTLKITAPTIGQSLTIGQIKQIQWTGSSSLGGSVLNIMLEDKNGSGSGYIATNISGTNHFDWNIGKVNMPDEQVATIPPGEYRIKIVDQLSSNSIFNMKGDIFSIKEAALSIGSILPSSVVADGKTEVILYGSGFTNLTKVRFEGLTNISLTPQYISPNGKMIWFYIPINMYADNYKVSVYNDYSTVGSSMASSSSNTTILQVTK